MKKHTASIRLPADTLAVLRDVAEAHRLPQGVIVDRGVSTELIRMMAAGKPADVMADYRAWTQRNKGGAHDTATTWRGGGVAG